MSKTSSASAHDSLRSKLAAVYGAVSEELHVSSAAKDVFLYCLVAALLESGKPRAQRTREQRLSRVNSRLRKFGIEPLSNFSARSLKSAERILEDVKQIVKEFHSLPEYKILHLGYDLAGHVEDPKSGVHVTDAPTVDLMSRLAVATVLSTKSSLSFEKALAAVDGEVSPSNKEIIESVLSRMKFTDPACGSGAFLHGILDVVEQVGHVLGNQQFLISSVLDNLCGVELDRWGIRLAKLGLSLRFKDNIALAAKLQIHHGDYLLPGTIERIGPVDLVIGNPPYVRNELMEKVIPTIPGRATGRSYKEEVFAEASHDWTGLTLDRGADLYVYFFLRGLHHLRSGGALCLITSNSWLDCDYGRSLQELLLWNSDILCILGWSTRSFRADIDPAISLIVKRDASMPVTELSELVDKTVRFIWLENLSYHSLRDALSQDSSKEQLQSLSWNETCRPQLHLCRELSSDRPWTKHKWGGRFLRAPEIYRRIFEDHAPLFSSLDSIARIRSGVHSRANDFFILRRAAEERGKSEGTLALISQLTPNPIEIEERFLRPIVTSQRLHSAISIEQTDRMLLVVDLPREFLRRFKVSEYVRLGEDLGVVNRPELSKRARSSEARRQWYEILLKEPGPILLPKVTRDKHRVNYNPHLFLADGNFYSVIPKENVNTIGLLLYLNSSLAAMTREVIGRTNVLGALKVEGVDWALMPIPQVDLLKELAERFTETESFAARPIQPLKNEISTRDRNDLDTLLLELLQIKLSPSEIHNGLLYLRTLRSVKESRASSDRSLPESMEGLSRLC